MLIRLLILFIVVPLVELALLLELAKVTGVQTTLLLVIITGVIGTILARSQGLRTFQEIHRALGEGRVPTDSLIDAVLIFVAGIVLLTPGMLTDLMGFILLIPFTRRPIRSFLVQWFTSRFKMQTSFGNRPNEPRESIVVDSHVIEPGPDREE